METEDSFDRILSLVSNSIRRQVIGFLSIKGSLSFSELMEYCGLDIFQQCGLMDYHLKILVESHVLKKDERYELTDYGKNVCRFLDSVRKIEVGVMKMEKIEHIPNLRIEWFEEKYVEAVAKAWMQIFGFDDKYIRKALDHFQSSVFGVKDSASFVALIEDKVAGFLDCEHVKLVSFCKTYGELGYIHGSNRSWISSEFKEDELQKNIFARLVESFEEYFKSLDAYGLFSPDISPELNKFDPLLRRVLTEQGFHVQNINYEMRKDFKIPQLKGLDKQTR